MVKYLNAILIVVIMAMCSPGHTSSTPIDVTPENGCVFAQHVLREIEIEDARIRHEFQLASMAMKVVLVVQKKSGENLQRNTKEWMQKHCIAS